MHRISSSPRKDWKKQAESLGFRFHTIGGEAYWDESAYYQFTMKQIEKDIEEPTAEIHQMCLHLVDKAINSEQMMEQLRIPEYVWDYVRESWLRRDSHLYGRMDFSYDGQSAAKFYEYNADTPTSLYESAFFQWLWLEQMIDEKRLPTDTDQFNIIQEMLIEALVLLRKQKMGSEPLYFSSSKDSEEDYGTVEYFRDCAVQAGLNTRFIYTEDIGLSPDGHFTDLDDMTISGMFKLYPWEFMFEEAFGNYLPGNETLFIEPPWKAILSNKGILPLLWREFKGHPNLLPSYFEDEKPGDDLGNRYVKKPVFSREGANISVMENGRTLVSVDGPYVDSGYILQKYDPLPEFAGNYALVGSWVVADRPAGIGIREDNSIITKDSSRFIPHIIRD
ncbi:glutathionylspermidine synthase family protein [Endozoicomonas sp.]|uniref:glutathionylspermidine synthase family protein n=1 Tax=Endozoicomonas sp. TaxID=1892382 RepID=UPI00383B0884